MEDRRFKDNKTCTNCNQEKPLTDFYYHRERRKHMNTCKICNSQKCLEYQQKKRAEGDPRRIMISRSGDIRRRAKLNGVPVMEKLGEYLFDLWNLCEGKCHYTGRPMAMGGRDHDSVTVDRIKPELGYVEGNLVLCTHQVNRVKQDLSIEELLSLVEEITRYRRSNQQGLR